MLATAQLYLATGISLGEGKKSAELPFWFRAYILKFGLQFASLYRPTFKIYLYIYVCCNLF